MTLFNTLAHCQILYRIVPNEPIDNNNIILEVTAGVGGNEAFLFAGEVFEMYERYATYKGWGFTVINEDLMSGAYGTLPWLQ